MSGQKAILVADDSPDDVFILEKAIRLAGLDIPLTKVEDGDEAMEYLLGKGRFEDRIVYPMPNLLLLDLKMPRIGGFEVLSWLHEQPTLKRLPVAVLTSSFDDKDVNRAYDLGANSYLVKPVSLDGYVGVMEKLRDYWLKLNLSPDV